jgi:hypothetical protein
MAQLEASLLDRLVPSRSAAKKASMHFADQLSSPVAKLGGRNGDQHTPLFGEPSRPKGTVSNRYVSKAKARGATTKSRQLPRTVNSSPPPTVLIKGNKGRNKRQLSWSPSLSSAEDGADSQTALSLPATPVPPSTLSQSTAVSRTPKSRVVRSKPSSVAVKSVKTSTPRTPKSKPRETWDLSECASFVFVLVNQRGEVVEDEFESSDEIVFWWPGKVRCYNPPSLLRPICMIEVRRLPMCLHTAGLYASTYIPV